jgi:hypothetical protein
MMRRWRFQRYFESSDFANGMSDESCVYGRPKGRFGRIEREDPRFAQDDNL